MGILECWCDDGFREMVEETVTLKTGDILHVGQTDLQIEIIKPN